MVKLFKELRPNCHQILKDRKSWILSLNDIENDADFEGIRDRLLNSKEIEDNFVLLFMNKKLKF
jgi:hypothetical protein